MTVVTCARGDTFPCVLSHVTFNRLQENIKILGAIFPNQCEQK